MKAFLRNFYIPLLFMAFIFIISSIPGESDDKMLKFIIGLDPSLQNFLHIPLYGTLQFLWLQSFKKLGKKGIWSVLICFLITIGYGVFDEFHQTFVPGRYGSLKDMLMNGLGALSVTIFYLYYQRAEFLKFN